MAIVWLPSLPQAFKKDSYERQPQANTVESAMSTGPAKSRRRGSAKKPIHSGVYAMTDVQFDAFEAFYYATTKEGVLPFEWPGPFGNQTMKAKIASWTAAPVETDLWSVPIRIEERP
ncbi:MAG: hypothetical protein AB7E47_03345 [Desulfovibrionaceae bacterium]